MVHSEEMVGSKLEQMMKAQIDETLKKQDEKIDAIGGVLQKRGEKIDYIGRNMAAMFESIKSIQTSIANQSMQASSVILSTPVVQLHNPEPGNCCLYERFDAALVELEQLQETNGIEDYHHRFELTSAGLSLSEEYLVHVFLAGLSSDTQMHVRMFNPQTIRHCFLLGKLHEWTLSKKTSENTERVACEDDEGCEDASMAIVKATESVLDPVLVPQLQDTNITQQQDLIHNTKSIMDVDYSCEHKSHETIVSHTVISCVPQSQVSISTLELSRRCHEGSLVFVDDLPFDFAKIDGISVETIREAYSYEFKIHTSTPILHICEKHKVIGRCERANRVWKPGGLSCVQAQWDWFGRTQIIGQILQITKLHRPVEWIRKVEQNFCWQELKSIWCVGYTEDIGGTSIKHELFHSTAAKHVEKDVNHETLVGNVTLVARRSRKQQSMQRKDGFFRPILHLTLSLDNLEMLKSFWWLVYELNQKLIVSGGQYIAYSMEAQDNTFEKGYTSYNLSHVVVISCSDFLHYIRNSNQGINFILNKS